MFFDTLKINCSVAAKDIVERAEQRQINLRVYTEGVVRTQIISIKALVVKQTKAPQALGCGTCLGHHLQGMYDE